MTSPSCLLSVLLWVPFSTFAQPTIVTTDHVQAQLIAYAPTGVGPGKDVRLALSIQHQPHWHTYWKNPGDSGLPTTFAWQLPPGVEAGDIEWPTPKILPIGPLMNYGYEDQIVLPASIKIPQGFASSELAVKLHAEWLVCKGVCVPESADLALTVPANEPTSSYAQQFESARASVPGDLAGARASGTIDGESLLIEVDGLPSVARGHPIALLPEQGGILDPAAPLSQRWEGSRWIASAPLSPQRSEKPTGLQAVLTTADQPAGMRLLLPIKGSWPGDQESAAGPATTSEPIAPAIATSFALTLMLAFAGGVLLNLMPCVFPVLSLKLLGFTRPGEDRRSLAAGGVAYTVGVVVAFIALAALLIGLRAGGEQLGWGFQLQSPLFVSLLAALFTLIGLNLAGLYEFGSVLPSGLATLRARSPVVDHALTGVLAVAVASPCTGPFMGAALGAALTLPATQALTVFAVLGLGMGLPYLAACLVPSLARRLPKPGAWMVRFKVLMSFPMFATVVWLVWVLGQQVGIDGVAGLLAVLVALGFIAWTWASPGFGRMERWGYRVVALAVLACALVLAAPHLQPVAVAVASTTESSGWKPWSQSAVTEAQAKGRPVFVDFTAAWCVSCQVNKLTTLSKADVRADFKRRDVLLLKADWTRRDPAITQELTRLGRSGVPVYALYLPGGAGPVLLPEILSSDDIHRALSDIPLARASQLTSIISTRSPR